MQILSNYWLPQLLDYNGFLDDGKHEEFYEHVNWMIFDGNVMNMYLIIMEGTYGAIYTYDCSCHGYYIIKFPSSSYTLHSDFSINGQVIYYGEMVC